MKLGKVKLRRILSKETGVPVRSVIDHGRYEILGDEERLVLGSRTIIALNGQVKLREPVYPVYEEEEITYRTRIIWEV